MNIGQAVQLTGVTAKMIRYYESIGLINQSKRTASGYRIYTHHDLHILQFIKRARKFGFSLGQIRELLSLWRDSDRASADVKAIALDHIANLQKQIDELTAMCDTLNYLAHCCTGDKRPECPILKDLDATSAYK